MPETNDSPLRVDQIEVDYGDGPVLRDLDCRVESGSFLAVLGASGCGKSSLLRAIAGFVAPTRGSIVLAGRTVFENGVERVPAEARGVGMVFQDYALFPHLNVADNIAFGLPKGANRQRVSDMLELVDMQGYESRRPHELSGGQQQRVAIARALAPRPRLVLLDEPFANLDATLRSELSAELGGMLRREGAAGLMVTHDREEALALADEILILGQDSGQGSAIQRGTAREVYEQPISAAVARLTGDGTITPGQALRDGESCLAMTPFGRILLALDLEGDIDVLIRPEDLEFQPTPEGKVTLAGRRFAGPRWRLRLEAEGASVEVDWEGRDAPQPGARGILAPRRPLWAWKR